MFVVHFKTNIKVKLFHCAFSNALRLLRICQPNAIKNNVYFVYIFRYIICVENFSISVLFQSNFNHQFSGAPVKRTIAFRLWHSKLWNFDRKCFYINCMSGGWKFEPLAISTIRILFEWFCQVNIMSEARISLSALKHFMNHVVEYIPWFFVFENSSCCRASILMKFSRYLSGLFYIWCSFVFYSFVCFFCACSTFSHNEYAR